jgi:hypothetical protein
MGDGAGADSGGGTAVGTEASVTVVACLIADGDTFVSRPVERLTLDFGGIVGDHHAGLTRRSGPREPWYPRGTEIRNDRQVTIVSSDELTEVAAAMSLEVMEPGWIGANLVLAGLPDLTLTPSGTRLFFAGGATLLVEGENKPCRVAGASIGAHAARDGLDLLFPKVARHKRGLIASVEKPGILAVGESIRLRRPAVRP